MNEPTLPTELPGQLPAAEIRQWLTERLSAHLGMASELIEPDVLLAEYGLDSLHAIALITDIEDHWGLSLDATVAWEFPTVDRLAEHLTGRIPDAIAG
ncbi:acyl carrier protein [Streptomyces sp. NPDC005322]|uniref:acyl carrier protein n=1 Tax=unclassified Streptomyces TaxID=2593676 RepID=UPI00339F11D3